MRVATEEAFVTSDILKSWRILLDSGTVEPGFRAMGKSILGTGPGVGRIHDQLLDLGEHRIAQMDRDGISMQVLSLTAPGVQVFEPDQALALARDANDVLADAVRRRPDRFAGLAAIAPNDALGSVVELQRARERLGLCGVIINSHTAGRYLDELEYFPILEAAEALSLPIYLHPREPGPGLVTPYLDYGLYFAGWGFAAECGLHAMRLIMSGTFDRLPGLRFILGHMGEGIPFWLDRIDNRYELQLKIGAVKKLERLPSDYFRENFSITTSGMTTLPPLRLALDCLGPERIMFAADYPYENASDAVRAFDATPVAPADREAMYWRNAKRVFGLPISISNG